LSTVSQGTSEAITASAISRRALVVVVLVDDDDVAEPLQRGFVAEDRGWCLRAVPRRRARDDRRREVGGDRLGVRDGDVDRVAVDRDPWSPSRMSASASRSRTASPRSRSTATQGTLIVARMRASHKR